MNISENTFLRSDPRLSRFDPLSRIIYFDDFDEGMNGWTALIGNYEHSLDNMLPGFKGFTQPMLSSCSHWDTGSHGSFDGTYALKIATSPRAGVMNTAIKRVTWRHAGPIQLELYFAFKPEASELLLSELDVRSVGFLFDLRTVSTG